MKYIELKAVMKLVQSEREQFHDMLKESVVPSSAEGQLALKHFRNILRRLTVWTEEAKEGKGPIVLDRDSVYVLRTVRGDHKYIHSVHKTLEGAKRECDRLIAKHKYTGLLFLEIDKEFLED